LIYIDIQCHAHDKNVMNKVIVFNIM